MKFPKTKKKSERKRLVKRLDTVFSLYIRHRDERCVTCGTKENLQCSHYIGRRAHGGYGVRWNEKDAYAQCFGCHFHFHNSSPEPLRQYIVSMHGEETIAELEELAHSPSRLTNTMLEEMIEYYKEKP